jgi:hypothetical protein
VRVVRWKQALLQVSETLFIWTRKKLQSRTQSDIKSRHYPFKDEARLNKNAVRTAKKTPHVTITKISWLTLFKEIIKKTNTLCGKNAKLLNVKACGTYSYHWVLKGYNQKF